MFRSVTRFSLQLFIVIVILPVLTKASSGDNSPYFSKCWRLCLSANCTADGESYKAGLEDVQPAINKLLFWKCTEECQYDCMWKTVDAFHERKWATPQFFGKWPFLRVAGIQELGSTIGSILNLISHAINYTYLRRNVQKNHPMFWVWRLFTVVCFNAWIWSTVFHVRDTYFTELMDYMCAFSMVIVVFYCFGMRVLYGKKRMYRIAFSCLCTSYFINHVYYLYTERIDYGFNMIANIAAGVLGGTGWLTWSAVQWWRGRHYVWRCVVFVMCAAISTLLEISDFPPWFNFWDAHALWHVSTAPLPFLFYRFIVDDCKFMKKRLE